MSQIRTIMTADDYGQALVQFAEQTARQLVKAGLTRSQMRTIFTEVRKIEALWGTDPQGARRRLELLKPKLAYQTERVKAMQGLKQVLTEAIDYIQGADSRAFERFVELMEAILAYHRAQGGRS